jgi:diguanylate cyclase (GGDEF)-like protein
MIENNLEVFKSLNVLYVEDEEMLRNTTINILQSFTGSQLVARNGEEGLKLFRNNHDLIDVVITDISMPKQDGLTMAKEIRSINPQVPIIVVTAFSTPEYLQEAINIGIDKYISKPMDAKKLLNSIDQTIGYHELRDLYFDNLTQLPNRNKLKQDLKSNENSLIALMNIDEFSSLNDIYGEDNGDTVLKEFAKKLQHYFSQSRYSIYRSGADKFTVIAKDGELSIDIFEKICRDFAFDIENNNILTNETDIDVNITIGIARDSSSNAYKCAERAISYARTNFKRLVIYSDDIYKRESFENNIYWIKQLKYGLLHDSFVSYLQPIYDANTNEIIKYESLVRLIDQEGAIIPPVKFLGLAKKIKLLPSILQLMVRNAINLNKEYGPHKIAINISFYEISNSATVDYILEIIENNKEYAKNITFEILEVEEIIDFDLVNDFIQKVKSVGCCVGIDDFGAGYSNFNLLTKLNIDFVKIDGSLISNIDKNEDLRVIVETIVHFTKKFGFRTIAEYVHSKEVLDIVKDIGVDMVQGYYLSEPKDPAELLL